MLFISHSCLLVNDLLSFFCHRLLSNLNTAVDNSIPLRQILKNLGHQNKFRQLQHTVLGGCCVIASSE